MREVCRAKDIRLGRDVALKALPESVTQDPECLARFRREAQCSTPGDPESDSIGDRLA
jgi:serine/threonine-protein kinase